MMEGWNQQQRTAGDRQRRLRSWLLLDLSTTCRVGVLVWGGGGVHGRKKRVDTATHHYHQTT